MSIKESEYYNFCSLDEVLPTENILFEDEDICESKGKALMRELFHPANGLLRFICIVFVILGAGLIFVFSAADKLPSDKVKTEGSLTFGIVGGAIFLLIGILCPVSSIISAMTPKHYIVTDKALYIYKKKREHAERVAYRHITYSGITVIKRDQSNEANSKYLIEISYEVPANSSFSTIDSANRPVRKVTIRRSNDMLRLYDLIENGKKSSPQKFAKL